MSTPLRMNAPLELPCGVVLSNRLVKAAMTEGMADAHNRSTPELETLYRRWAAGGCGALLTGNVQVDRRYMERPGNVAVDRNGGDQELRALARAGGTDNCQLWAQVGHAGRQVNRLTWPEPVGPSAIGMGEHLQRFYPKPRALESREILDVVERFAQACATLKTAGFGGVQVHAAHGYLISSFLSPLANHRSDRFGGSLENRARLLLDTLRAVRDAVGPDYPVTLKLNSSDFQTGGFTLDDCCQVVKWLGGVGLDLLEISGGSYMLPAMIGGPPQRGSTRTRQAYFLEYARRIAGVASMPLMVTGGFRSAESIEAALAEGTIDVVGLARPLIMQPEIARAFQDGAATEACPCEQNILWQYEQLRRLGRGDEPDPELDETIGIQATIKRDAAQAEGLVGRAT